MKRTSLLILTLLICGRTASSAQEPADLDELLSRRGVYLQPRTLEPYTGPVVAAWSPQTVRERGTLKGGRWDGVHELYYQNGLLAVRETYRSGVLDGPFESYFRGGSPSDRGTYRDGLLDGPYESFWLREPAERGSWTAGKMCGEWVTYYPSSSYGRRLERATAYPPCPSGSQ